MSEQVRFFLILLYLAGIAFCGIGIVAVVSSGLAASSMVVGLCALGIGASLLAPALIIGSRQYFKQARYSLAELLAVSLSCAVCLALMRPHYPFHALTPGFILAGALAGGLLMTGVLARVPLRVLPRVRMALIVASVLTGGGFGEPILSCVALISYVISIPLLGIKPLSLVQKKEH